MLNCLCKKTTMSFDEFSAYTKGEITLRQIRNSHQIEDFINKVTRNKRSEKFVVTLMASALYVKESFALSPLSACGNIDSLGMKFLTLVRHWAYWILLVMCIVEIIRAGISGDSKKILGIIVKFLIIFGSMYLVPELFDAIKNAF